MNIIRRILIGGLITVAAAGLASATSIAGSCSGVSGPNELGVLGNTGVQTQGTITCSRYNLNPTWLQDVVVTITGSINGTITLTNNTQVPNTYNGKTLSDFFLQAALPGFAGLGVGDANAFFTASFTTGDQSIAANSSTSFGPFESSTKTTGPQTNSDSSTFGTYTGEGNFSFTVDTLTGLLVSGGGGGGGGTNSTSGVANATVTYDYVIPSGTPEPATMLLFGSGLLGLGILRKRAKR
jgi:hypothetical protein